MKNLFNNSGNFGSYIVNKDQSVSILLYGDIGENVGVSSEMIVARLMELSKTYSHIDVRINSNGGDVFSGFAIYNALKSSSMDITIHVDGLAASIAGAIALCGKPVYMSRNARLMLHGVSVGMYGNKQEFERVLALIHSLEGSLANMLSHRLKMSEEEIKSRFFDGVDHWFTAEEALQQGLIDGIDEPLEELKGLEVNNKNPQEIYSIYYNHFVNMNTTPDFFNKVKEISFFSSMNEAEILDCLAVFAQQGITNVSARAALQFACKRGFITEDERDNMYSVLGGDPIKTAQYIRVKEDIYNKNSMMNMWHIWMSRHLIPLEGLSRPSHMIRNWRIWPNMILRRSKSWLKDVLKGSLSRISWILMTVTAKMTSVMTAAGGGCMNIDDMRRKNFYGTPSCIIV